VAHLQVPLSVRDGRCSECDILPPFQNIRCFRFVKRMYLDMF
jgi:hypothetical protein